MSNKIPDNVDKSCGCLIEDILTESEDSKCTGQPENSDYNKKERIMVDPDVEKISLDFYQKKFTDGLPIIPPPLAGLICFINTPKGIPRKYWLSCPLSREKRPGKKLPLMESWPAVCPILCPFWKKQLWVWVMRNSTWRE